MNVRPLFAALLFSASIGATLVACSAAPTGSPEEQSSASSEALRIGHACPPTCDPGTHCGTICETCAVRDRVPPIACDPIPNFFECVPDVCPGPDAAPRPPIDPGPGPVDPTPHAP